LKRLLSLLLAVLFLSAMAASADDRIRKKQVRFRKGASGATVTGIITGDHIVDYQLRANAGQSMVVLFTPDNPSAYFNVLPSNSETALFVGSVLGNRFDGRLPADGVYTIRVYLMRSAACRNESTKYTLAISIADAQNAATAPIASSAALGAPFDRTLELQGVRFHVTCANDGPSSTLQIIPAGLEIDNSPIVRTIEGAVTGAEVADLNGDGSPEVYVFVTSTQGGLHGTLVAYSANRRKSLSEVYLPPLTQAPAASKGYRGHDAFAVLEGFLGRRFPVYRDTDSDTDPSGGMRQVQYKLIPGEAGWILKVDRVVDN